MGHPSKRIIPLVIFVISLSACTLVTGENPPPTVTSSGPVVERIAFYSTTGFYENRKSAIYVMDADGANLSLLAKNSGVPVWSPDGQHIAFMSQYSIYLMNRDGSDKTRLTDIDNAILSMAWSPDSQRIAFIVQEDDDSSSLYLINVTDTLKGVSENRPKFLNSIWGLADDLRWSPDSQQIVFSYQVEYHEPFKVAVLNVADALQKPNERAWIDLGEGIQPAWSPDSQHIVFFSWSNDDYRGIYVMDTNGSDKMPLTHGVLPAWSPDGKHIVFVSPRDDNYEIYVMNMDGSQQTRLTNDLAEDTSPAWSPDSKQIAFVSKRDGNQEIYVMNTDGSDQRRLTNTPEDEWDPVWSP